MIQFFLKIKSIFGYDLKLLSFLKMKHVIYKESTHLQKFVLFKKKLSST